METLSNLWYRQPVDSTTEGEQSAIDAFCETLPISTHIAIMRLHQVKHIKENETKRMRPCTYEMQLKPTVFFIGCVCNILKPLC